MLPALPPAADTRPGLISRVILQMPTPESPPAKALARPECCSVALAVQRAARTQSLLQPTLCCTKLRHRKRRHRRIDAPTSRSPDTNPACRVQETSSVSSGPRDS